MGGLDVEAARRADARFEAMLDESFSVLLPNADDFGLAKRYLGQFETASRTRNKAPAASEAVMIGVSTQKKPELTGGSIQISA
jgi:hypothetical protein